MLSLYQISVSTCHKCKEYSQTQRGGCAGPCPCHWDGKDIIEHAKSGYCPMGKYPLSGLGSVLAKLLWKSRIPWLLRSLKIYRPSRCKCAKRQSRLNALGKRLMKLIRPGSE